MSQMPEWLQNWIQKDRLVRNKFKISREYLRHSKRIQFVSGDKNGDGKWVAFHYVVHSPKYGRYHVRYDNGTYHCNCPFFKRRLICSHILGVCQRIKIYPQKESLFSNKTG